MSLVFPRNIFFFFCLRIKAQLFHCYSGALGQQLCHLQHVPSKDTPDSNTRQRMGKEKCVKAHLLLHRTLLLIFHWWAWLHPKGCRAESIVPGLAPTLGQNSLPCEGTLELTGRQLDNFSMRRIRNCVEREASRKSKLCSHFRVWLCHPPAEWFSLSWPTVSSSTQSRS